MMAGRTQRDKGVFGSAAHDLIDGCRSGADAMADRSKTLRAHHGVWIEVDSSPRRGRGLDRVNVMRGVNTQDRRAVKSGGIRPDKGRKALAFEGRPYRADTVWTLRMTRPGIVIEIR
jgi:hypothetical protein